MDQAEAVHLTQRERFTAPPIPGLTFDPEPHVYRFQGAAVPSVTQVLKPIENWDFLDEEAKAFYSARGTEVHRATALNDMDDLVEDSVDQDIRGYLTSWRLLLKNQDLKILSVEEQVYHPLLRIAGTMDRRMLIKRRLAVLDIKAGVKLASHGVQVFGYRRLYNHGRKNAEHILDCYTAYLDKEGGLPKLVKWDDLLHDSQFVALCTDRNWRTKYAN